MPDLELKISGPLSTIVDSVSKVAVAIIENDTTRRETMSPEARAEQDRILAQMYWDWRGLLARVGIVDKQELPSTPAHSAKALLSRLLPKAKAKKRKTA